MTAAQGKARPRGRERAPTRPAAKTGELAGDGSRSVSSEPTTWAPIDLAAIDEIAEEASILVRSDGVGLLYPGRVHWIQGEPESHKTWVVLIAVAQVLNAGGNAIYIDFEDHPSSVKARLIALGVPEDVVNDPARFAYIRPDEPLGAEPNSPQALDLLAAAQLLGPRIVAIDGVSEAMRLEGLNPLDTPDTAEWIRRLPKRIAAEGPAVPVIDHQAKSTDNRKGGWAFGSQHKKAGTDGAAYEVVAVRKLARAFGSDPVEGLITLKIVKDRPGYVRGHTRGDTAATVRLTAWPDGGVTYSVTTDAVASDWELRVRIAKYLDGNPGASKTDLRTVSGRNDYIDDAVAAMVIDGHIEVQPQGNKKAHYLTDEGRATYLGEDPL